MIKIAKEEVIELTEWEYDKAFYEYSKAFMYHSGPVPSFETWYRNRRNRKEQHTPNKD